MPICVIFAAISVAITVELYGEILFATEEVDNERFDWHLTDELQAEKATRAEMVPENFFWPGLSLP